MLVASDRGASRLAVLSQLPLVEGDGELAFQIVLEELPLVPVLSPGQASISTAAGWSPLPPDKLTWT